MEPPTSERILFSFMESNWLDGLARTLQEGLARLCRMSGEALKHPRFSHLARRNSAGEPMDMSSHPAEAPCGTSRLHAVPHSAGSRPLREYANQTHARIIEQGDTIKMLANDRRTLRQQRTKRDATITRLRAKIAALEATFKAQEEQMKKMEEDGEDIQGGSDYLSDDNDFEEDENTRGKTTISWTTEMMTSPPSMLMRMRSSSLVHYRRTRKSLVDKHPCHERGTVHDLGRFQAQIQQVPCAPGLIKKMRDEFRETRPDVRGGIPRQVPNFVKVRPDEAILREEEGKVSNGLHDEMQTVLINIPFADLEALVDSAIQMEGKLHQASENRKRRMMNRVGLAMPQGGHHNNNNSNYNANNNFNRAPPRAPNNNTNSTNTAPRTGSNAVPVNPKDKSTINCYECGVVGHYSNECPKKLAKIAANTAALLSNSAALQEEGTRTTTTAVSTT
ncbi:hypothetical protein QYE76_008395 [Lolium multiflorum]|uniref:CCHC-type domain-containing protein n=1 Tax=Lolium multiflorum TaxID=4521 RepID=A0AAD8WZX9_LOLMU|nr:hypothetical protein QYE76_008395 [Lolium multiflorum]